MAWNLRKMGALTVINQTELLHKPPLVPLCLDKERKFSDILQLISTVPQPQISLLFM